jgi:hypothetical protein
MRTFVIVIFILFLVESGIKLHDAGGEHPRKMKSRTFGSDLTQFAIFVGFATWAGWLLF